MGVLWQHGAVSEVGAASAGSRCTRPVQSRADGAQRRSHAPWRTQRARKARLTPKPGQEGRAAAPSRASERPCLRPATPICAVRPSRGALRVLGCSSRATGHRRSANLPLLAPSAFGTPRRAGAARGAAPSGARRTHALLLPPPLFPHGEHTRWVGWRVRVRGVLSHHSFPAFPWQLG